MSFEKIWLDFDEYGRLKPPAIWGGKTAMEKMAAAIVEIESTPALRRRYEALMEKKREEWRDREIARNLVE